MAFYENAMDLLNSQRVILLSIALMLSIWLLRSDKKFQNLPSGPIGWPIIGSLFRIEKESYLSFDKWGKKYGGFFTINLGWVRSRCVCLTNYAAVKCLLKDQADRTVSRLPLPLTKLGFTIPGSIVFENGYIWNERRRWTLGVLCSVALEQNHLENKINFEVDYLCQEFDKHGGPFNPLHCVNNALANIFCTISFGDRFEYSDTKFKELTEAIRYIFKYLTIVNPVNVFPFLFYTPMYRHFRKSTKSLKAFLTGVVHQHEKTFDPGHVRDLIDAYILESKKKDVKLEIFGIDLLWRTIVDLIIAGTDNTTCTIMWIIVYLVNYPDVQLKIQQEIGDVLGQEKRPTWSNRHSMPYLEATIMEIQRISNPVPLFGRSTSEEVYIKGYKIPPGIAIIISLWSIHTDPNQWERPFEFEPERFLSDDLSSIKRHDAFMPFGAGRRACAGKLLARMELFLFTSNLLQRFTFSVAEGEPNPSEHACIPGVTRYPKPYKIVAIKR